MKLRCLFWVAAGLTGWPGLLPAAPAEDGILTTVYSTAYNGYARAPGPGGPVAPETYALGEGEHAGGAMRDDSNDDLSFRQLAQLLVPYLARQDYVPTRSPAGTDLLIVVHWGATMPYDGESYRGSFTSLQVALSPLQQFGGLPNRNNLVHGSLPPIGSSNAYRQQRNIDVDNALQLLAMQNELRDRANARNAALLGYLPELSRAGDLGRCAGPGTYARDLTADVEEDRYYVILAAYDFRTAWRQKQRKLVWVTRVSIRAHGNRFDRDAEAMIRVAARYFGQDSPGLLRQRVPAGKVEVGEPKVIGIAPDRDR